MSQHAILFPIKYRCAIQRQNVFLPKILGRIAQALSFAIYNMEAKRMVKCRYHWHQNSIYLTELRFYKESRKMKHLKIYGVLDSVPKWCLKHINITLVCNFLKQLWLLPLSAVWSWEPRIFCCESMLQSYSYALWSRFLEITSKALQGLKWFT